MKNYDKNKESSYIIYLDANNLHGWVMSQKLSVGIFKWIKYVSVIDEKFIKNYDNDSDIGFILKVDIRYPEKLHDLHSDLPFLSERMKINKCNKLVCTLYDKNSHVVHLRNLKQVLEHGFKLKKCVKQLHFVKKHGLRHILIRIQN